jgi:hypothetical protein
MGYKSRSRRLKTFLIEAHIVWTYRTLNECAGGIVHDYIGVEEDILDSLKRAFSQESQWSSNLGNGKTYPGCIRWLQILYPETCAHSACIETGVVSR